MGTLIRLALRRTLSQIRHVARVRPGRGGDLVVGVHRQVEADFGLLAPPIALHTCVPAALAASWAMLRESLVATGVATRAAKEAVAAGVSERNNCHYCAEVHATTTKAIAETGSDREPLAEWGRTGGAGTAPFGCDQAPEYIGTAVAVHYLNRMAGVFLDDSPLPPGGTRDAARQVLARALRPHATREHRPGSSLPFLPAAEPAADLAWAAANPVLANAFARAYHAIDSAAAELVPADVRAVVTGALDAWDGTPVGMSRAWAYDQAAGLPHESIAAGVLALLTAKAAYQTDGTIVRDFRRGRSDAELVALTSWAALAAARRLGPGRARVPHTDVVECACSAHQRR